jgi:hypothetical protein
MDFIESREWRIALIVLSSIIVVAFIASRVLINESIVTISVYIGLHLYQLWGLIVSYFTVEFDNYFGVSSIKCVEIIFFVFFATPYCCIVFITRIAKGEYMDNEDSPWWGLIVGIPIPLWLVAMFSPIFEEKPDFVFMISFFIFLIFYAYWTYAVMDRWMDKFKLEIFPYLNPITWIAMLCLYTYYSIIFKWDSEAIKIYVRRHSRQGKCVFKLN